MKEKMLRKWELIAHVLSNIQDLLGDAETIIDIATEIDYALIYLGYEHHTERWRTMYNENCRKLNLHQQQRNLNEILNIIHIIAHKAPYCTACICHKENCNQCSFNTEYNGQAMFRDFTNRLNREIIRGHEQTHERK
jgi:hypothetical protein